MLEIQSFTCENKESGCITDNRSPAFRYYATSDRPGTAVMHATVSVGEWTADVSGRKVSYAGAPLKLRTVYSARLLLEGNRGERAEKTLTFETGKLDEPWTGKWLSAVRRRGDNSSATIFKRTFLSKKKICSARIYATAVGVYSLFWNGKRVGREYFASGYTADGEGLRYQVYDVADLIEEENEVRCLLLDLGQKGERAAFSCEIHLLYTDGEEMVVATNEYWRAGTDKALRLAKFAEEEEYDAPMSEMNEDWRKVSFAFRRKTMLSASEFCLAEHGRFSPVPLQTDSKGTLVYDMGQTFVGSFVLKLKGEAGQKVVVRLAAEPENGEEPAVKYTLRYTCRSGEQTYVPTAGYAFFRYVLLDGVDASAVEIEGVSIYPDGEEKEHFLCSDESLNARQRQIVWSERAASLRLYLASLRETGGSRREKEGLREKAWVYSPWETYRETGEADELKKAYPRLKKYVCGRIPTAMIALFADRFFRKKEQEISSAWQLFLVAERAARIAGETKDAEHFLKLAQKFE